MRRRLVEIPLFVIVLIALFVWAGDVVTRAAGATRRAAPGEGISLENGERIFWSTGKCHTCHAVGSEGRSVRGPNLGDSEQGPALAVRAVARARARSAALGREISPADYLVESLTEPGAFVTEGFKDEMPVVYEPPIALTADELTSVVLYLQSLGGEPDLEAITIPPAVRAHGLRRELATPWEPYLDGDSARGRALFFDRTGPAACVTCHRVGDHGGSVGPELTGVAGTRTAAFIVESLLEPSASIANGYETVLVELTSGRLVDGIVRRETADSVWLATSTGEELAFAAGDVQRRRTQETSLMPENLAELLTVRQLHDLLAFLRTLQ